MNEDAPVRINANPRSILVRLAFAGAVLVIAGLLHFFVDLAGWWAFLVWFILAVFSLAFLKVGLEFLAACRHEIYVDLDPDGFFERSMGHTRRARWIDCSRFVVWGAGGPSEIYFNNAKTHKRFLSFLTKWLTLRDHFILARFEISADALCERMNGYRDRAFEREQSQRDSLATGPETTSIPTGEAFGSTGSGETDELPDIDDVFRRNNKRMQLVLVLGMMIWLPIHMYLSPNFDLQSIIAEASSVGEIVFWLGLPIFIAMAVGFFTLSILRGPEIISNFWARRKRQ